MNGIFYSKQYYRAQFQRGESTFTLFFFTFCYNIGLLLSVFSSQVVLSSNPSFVPQLSGPDSHGLRHLTPGQNTDLLHLCGSHTNMHIPTQTQTFILYMHMQSQIRKCSCVWSQRIYIEISLCSNQMEWCKIPLSFPVLDHGLYESAIFYIWWVLHLLSHADIAALLCHFLQVSQFPLTTKHNLI